MMVTLNLDAWPQVHDDLRAGRVVTFVVDGEPAITERHHAACGPDCQAKIIEDWRATLLVPPARFRALPETCETCWGDDQLHTYRCPDCVGGVPLVEFVTPCSACAYVGQARIRDDHIGDTGQVRVARGTVQVLPVDELDGDDVTCHSAKPHVLTDGHSAWLCHGTKSSQRGGYIDVAPLPRVGQFVVEITPQGEQ